MPARTRSSESSLKSSSTSTLGPSRSSRASTSPIAAAPGRAGGVSNAASPARRSPARVERGHDRLPEARLGIVLLVERQPGGGGGRRAAFDPRAQERRLARSGRRREERQPPGRDGRGQALEEARARDGAPPPSMHGPELGFGDARLHCGRAPRDEFSRRSRLGPLVSWPQGRSHPHEPPTMMPAPVFGCVQTALRRVHAPPHERIRDASPRMGDFPARGVAAPVRHPYGRAQSARPFAVEVEAGSRRCSQSARIQSVMLPPSPAASRPRPQR